MRNGLGLFAAIAAVAPLAPAARAAGMDHHHHEDGVMTMSARHAPIEISINPEARVSVALGSPIPARNVCRRPITLAVKIMNDSFITARLEAHLVGHVPPGLALDFKPARLSGKQEDWRALTITLAEPGPKDVTISFKVRNDIPDLGGRDRIHFLIDCRFAERE
jgi:hypothetical protein